MPAAKGKYKVVVQQPSGGITFDLAEGAYAIEREALDPIGAEIVEVPSKTEEEFIAAAQDADAVIARNRRITAAIIKGLTYFKDIPRLYGQTIGLISFGNVAKAVARRCHAFGLHVLAYDPFLAELEMT